ncbi:hypothetical protein NXC12_PD00140 (plasmid) [Rhizobium etli]|uniref:Carbohydrate ABC transporter permease n=1 Tax=Rhizobium etli TaxID=29449 RepID=A0AAN1BL57_RHIET|nr:hypothetical protein NXC12_PD00140 [Rhizobium etli]
MGRIPSPGIDPVLASSPITSSSLPPPLPFPTRPARFLSASRSLGDRLVKFGQMAAASLAGIVPVYLVALFLQRYLVAGLAHGGLK